MDQFSSAPLSERKITERPSGVVASTTTRCGHSTSRRAAAPGSPTGATKGCGRPVRLETKTMPFPSRVNRPPELEKASTKPAATFDSSASRAASSPAGTSGATSAGAAGAGAAAGDCAEATRGRQSAATTTQRAGSMALPLCCPGRRINLLGPSGDLGNQPLGPLEQRSQLDGRLPGPVAPLLGAAHLAERLGELGVRKTPLDQDGVEPADASLELTEIVVHRFLRDLVWTSLPTFLPLPFLPLPFLGSPFLGSPALARFTAAAGRRAPVA